MDTKDLRMAITTINSPKQVSVHKNGKNYIIDELSYSKNFSIEYGISDSRSFRVSDGYHDTFLTLEQHYEVNKPDYERYVIDNLVSRFEQEIKERPDFRHTGPSNEELWSNPALMNAWQEFCVIRKLVGSSTLVSDTQR